MFQPNQLNQQGYPFGVQPPYSNVPNNEFYFPNPEQFQQMQYQQPNFYFNPQDWNNFQQFQQQQQLQQQQHPQQHPQQQQQQQQHPQQQHPQQHQQHHPQQNK